MFLWSVVTNSNFGVEKKTPVVVSVIILIDTMIYGAGIGE